MPYGIKDPFSYKSKQTGTIILPIDDNSCCTCVRQDVKIAPIHLVSDQGLIATFVCQSCFVFAKQHKEFTYEMLKSRKKRGYTKALIDVDRPNSRLDSEASCDVRGILTEMQQLFVRLLHLADVLSSSIISPEATHEVHVPEFKTVSEPVKTVSEPAKTVSEPAKTVSEPAKTVSEPAKRGRPRKVTTDSSEMTDEELFAGMSDEQRFKMDEAVALAKMREGMIPTEGGFIDPLDKTKDW